MRSLLMSLYVCVLAFAPVRAHATDGVDHKAIHQAMDECRTEAGLERVAKGQRPDRPTQAQRAVIDKCLVGKGIDLAELKKHHHHGPQAPARDTASEKGE